MAYFDNASTTYPKPEIVYSFMDDFYRNNGANAGRGNYIAAKHSSEIIAETRGLLKELLHCPLKKVIFQPSATISLNIIIQGLINSGIQTVYISPFEHNAVTRLLHKFEKEGRINVIQLTVTKSFDFDLKRIKYQFDNQPPDLLIVNHVSNVFGLVLSIEEVLSLAKKYNAKTVVDMSQSAGLVDCNVGSIDIDFAVFAGHKTLYGPTGISGFIMNPDIGLQPLYFGGTGYESDNQDMPDAIPQKYEAGTINIHGIAGLNAALHWIKKIGIENIWKKDQEHRTRLIDLLSEFSFIQIIGNTISNRYTGIVSCLIYGISSDIAASIFSKQNISIRSGLECAPLAHKFLGTYPSGTVRFSVSYFTSDEDYDVLFNALNYIEENR